MTPYPCDLRTVLEVFAPHGSILVNIQDRDGHGDSNKTIDRYGNFKITKVKVAETYDGHLGFFVVSVKSENSNAAVM